MGIRGSRILLQDHHIPIHLIWVPHDVMDPRTVSRREMREAFNQYMITVLREEPLDPTLLDYEDNLSW